ncbi:5-methylthioadenosine/S-adenosylhomocysteine deaminase [Symbiodinium microadriaticum]|uniref:5-methylthioadenosine/S-adenosylhomocysteine deaminase n=1 Tax=Symbiodinium microadriaticum TaxID=2951 RepID=A0A1Q9C4S9_SYMMI|nr:5-methylthioadenosine/S-adenosylhomocysteine deaminase [Symbiodinium microadriaticum]CAE7889282.1 mtaD [Symbiodinium microadriaticum]CAE7947700.1 mtaD [Symbiodinium sp. KB8]
MAYPHPESAEAKKRSLHVRARWVATAEPGDPDVLEDRVISVDLASGKITALTPASEFSGTADMHLTDHLVIPGLVNAHTHTPMSLLRGYADDLPLNEWLFQHIFPTEGKFVFDAPLEEAEEFVRLGSELACYEMLKTGTTLFNDMYFHGDVTANVARKAGMKAVLTKAGLLFFGDDALFSELVGSNTKFCAELISSEDKAIRPSLLPHSVYMVPKEKLQEVKQAYDKACNGAHVVIHTHVHETKKEIADVFERTGQSALQILDDLGMLNSRTVAAHCVHMTDEEIALMAKCGASVAHCPRSNLKLGSGIARTADMLKNGVNVCLGTDGASSNNTLDMLTEMQYASMVAKGFTGDPTVLSAREVLEMATLRGARALGLEAETGSIKVGKAADLVAVDLGRLEASPIYDPLGQLVYTNSRQVSHVWIDGKCIVQDGTVLTLLSMDMSAIEKLVSKLRDFRKSLPAASWAGMAPKKPVEEPPEEEAAEPEPVEGDETELVTGLKLPLKPNDVGRIWVLQDYAAQSKILTELLGLEGAHPNVARREIVCDFHLFNLSHAKMLCLTQRQGAVFHAIMAVILDMAKQGSEDSEGSAEAAECFKKFRELLVLHSVNDSPDRLAIFGAGEARRLTDYATTTLFKIGALGPRGLGTQGSWDLAYLLTSSSDLPAPTSGCVTGLVSSELFPGDVADLAGWWSELGLLYLKDSYADQVDPLDSVRVFNCYKSDLRTAITDRKDFYHQLAAEPRRATSRGLLQEGQEATRAYQDANLLGSVEKDVKGEEKARVAGAELDSSPQAFALVDASQLTPSAPKVVDLPRTGPRAKKALLSTLCLAVPRALWVFDFIVFRRLFVSLLALLQIPSCLYFRGPAFSSSRLYCFLAHRLAAKAFEAERPRAIADVFSRGLRKKILAGRAFDCDAYGVERVLVNDVALSLDSLDWTLTSARDHESHISCLESSAYLRLCYHNAKQARGPLVLPRSSTRMCRGVPLAKAVRAPGPSRRSSAGFPRFLWHVVFTEHFPSVLHALCRPMVPLVALRFFLLRALSLPCFDFAAGPPTGPVFVFTLFLGLFPRPWTGTPDGLP